MKVLMFGWEFPPHISGGLGTACYGLAKGLTETGGADILFVVPKLFGDEKSANTQLIGANNVAINQKEISFTDKHQPINYLEIDSPLVPYTGEEEYRELTGGTHSDNIRFVQTNEEYKIDFRGGYGGDLFHEVENYALVAEIIAANHSFDIIHAHDWLTWPAGIAASRLTGKPLIIHVHATEFDRSNGRINQNIYNIERAGMENASQIIAVSNITRNTIIERYNISPKKVTTVYNAVEPPLTAEGKTRKKTSNEKTVAFLGRITAQKGPVYFIDAANILLKKMNNVHFIMAGSGDMLNAMKARTAELNLTDKFNFPGFLSNSNVTRMLATTDVLVMPSISEPFGLVALEAMQAGVPVIISRQSGVAEIVENVIKIDFWNTGAIAEAIHTLLTHPTLAKTFKEEGKKEVQKLRWKDSAEKVCEIYRNALP